MAPVSKMALAYPGAAFRRWLLRKCCMVSLWWLVHVDFVLASLCTDGWCNTTPVSYNLHATPLFLYLCLSVKNEKSIFFFNLFNIVK